MARLEKSDGTLLSNNDSKTTRGVGGEWMNPPCRHQSDFFKGVYTLVSCLTVATSYPATLIPITCMLCAE